MNSRQSQLELITQLLREETTLSLATTGQDGQPSATPLFYFADTELSLYWLSSESSLHSLNLLHTPRVAATVYRSAKNWKQICGLQMRGHAEIITAPERRKTLLKTYCERFQLGTVFRMAIRRSALYRLQPVFFRYIDNSKAFGSSFELTRRTEGWTPSQTKT